MSLGVLIRFANSRETLPAVLAALRAQSVGFQELLGINNSSTDGSADLIRQAGGRVLDWRGPYQASEVLNAGIQDLPSDLILVMSSHTVMTHPEALAQLLAPMSDPQVVCSSLKWDDDRFSDRISFAELQTRGLKLGSIYSNSLGILRRSAWQAQPFRRLAGERWIEDYDWAVLQLKRGAVCATTKVGFEYLRKGGVSRESSQTSYVFSMAREHSLRVCWLGLRAALYRWILLVFRTSWGRRGQKSDRDEFQTVSARIRGSLAIFERLRERGRP